MKWAHNFDRIRQDTVPDALRTVPDVGAESPTADELDLPVYMSEYGPLISVVIPTYGDAHFLPDALSTVADQTYRNLEVLIVDASAVEWLQALAEDRDWIRYLDRPPKGLSHARNEAIEQARGEYVALLDADDLWHPTKLDRQLAAIREESSVCYSAIFELELRTHDSPSVSVKDRHLEDPTRAWIDRVHNRIYAMPSTLLLARDQLPPRPFAETVDLLEDFIFDVEQFYAHPPTHVSEPLTIYRNRKGSMSNDDMEAIHQAHFHAIDVIQQRLPEDTAPHLQSALAVIERDYANWLHDRGDEGQARQYRLRALLHKGNSLLKTGNIRQAKRHFRQAEIESTNEYTARIEALIGLSYIEAGYHAYASPHLAKSVRAINEPSDERAND